MALEEPRDPTEQRQPKEPEPWDTPYKFGDNGIPELQIPSRFVIVEYDIPENSAGKRDQARRHIKRAGLVATDTSFRAGGRAKGGSVYLGVKKPQLDIQLAKINDELKQAYGPDQEFIRMYGGGEDEYVNVDPKTARTFRAQIVRGAVRDMHAVEESLLELEKALVGEVKITHVKDGKEVEANLVTTGTSRIEGARNTLMALEAVAIRFDGTLQVDADRLRQRLAEIRAYVDKVAESFAGWKKRAVPAPAPKKES